MQRIRHLICRACGMVYIETKEPPNGGADLHGHCPRCGSDEAEAVGGERWL